jgi:hypothetical protein
MAITAPPSRGYKQIYYYICISLIFLLERISLSKFHFQHCPQVEFRIHIMVGLHGSQGRASVDDKIFVDHCKDTQYPIPSHHHARYDHGRTVFDLATSNEKV